MAGDAKARPAQSRAHVVFVGKVQGVFFRRNVQSKAMGLGVQGWIRNLPDGTVEAVFEGGAKRIDALIYWSSHEIPLAKVAKTDVKWEKATGEFTDMSIR